MNRFALCAWLLLSASGELGASFRIRSDFSAELNSDQGWAEELNGSGTVYADQPFRLRFEIDPAPSARPVPYFRLQYRRNGGDWTPVEAHDFPHPQAELEVAFQGLEVGATPPGWKTARGNLRDITVASDGDTRVLRVHAKEEPFLGLFTPPWESTEFEFATELRIPSTHPSGVAVVFGYVDSNNFSRVELDSAAGLIRVSRRIDGNETVLAEKSAAIPTNKWLQIEIECEDREVSINFENDAVTFSVDYEGELPLSAPGLSVAVGQVVDFRAMEIKGRAKTPLVSIVACSAYQHGAATNDLLTGSSTTWTVGAGISLSARTSLGTEPGRQSEFEWPLVVRRFADGAVTNEQGDSFEFRMVDPSGVPVSREANASVRLAIPAGHVGGTFVETPGRIGTWQAVNGDLYFIMEPAETSNLFMMIKSTDNGRTWREVDAANRPRTNDLESVDSRQIGDTIHIIHQVTHSSHYHAFRTSDHPTAPDTWMLRDEPAATVDSVAQSASLVVRSDGSIVAFHVSDTVNVSIRSSSAGWSEPRRFDDAGERTFAGPQAVLGSKDTVHVACYGMDGTIWYRQLLPDGSLTPNLQLASGLDTTRAAFGSVLPLMFDLETNTLIIIYRMGDGKLWERRIVNDGEPTPARRVTDRNVVLQAVDSQQPGADAVLDGGIVHVLFIEESSGAIFSTNDRGGWQSSIRQVSDIRGAWVRGNSYTRKDGATVYGFIYDAGSDGGAGMNRFAEVILAE